MVTLISTKPKTLEPVMFDPNWRTVDVLGLAQYIYQTGDFDAFGKLADALNDAGCEDDEIIGHCLSNCPHHKNCWVLRLILGHELNISIFKTLKLSKGMNAEKYRQLLKKKNMRIGTWADDILGKPDFIAVKKEIEVDLVVISVADLGFPEGAPLKDIFARAQEFGLRLCQNQVGPELRDQYEDQPQGEWLIIGMEPITDSDGDLGLFHVGRGSGGLWLDTNYDNPDHVWRGGRRFVFVLPRKVS